MNTETSLQELVSTLQSIKCGCGGDFFMELCWQDIGFRIKELRKEKKITIERLSEIIDTSPSFVGLVERGDSKISIDNLYKLSCALGTSVDYILTGERGDGIKFLQSKFSRLNATLFDYTEQEIDFIIELVKFLNHRVDIK
jgi:transcriptional regulator with XRE-family HTH domain